MLLIIATRNHIHVGDMSQGLTLGTDLQVRRLPHEGLRRPSEIPAWSDAPIIGDPPWLGSHPGHKLEHRRNGASNTRHTAANEVDLSDLDGSQEPAGRGLQPDQEVALSSWLGPRSAHCPAV